MKRFLVLITVACMMLGMTAYADFADVKAGDDGYEAIAVLNALGILKGFDEGYFGSSFETTRAEFCAFIVRMVGMPDSAIAVIDTDFSDVTADHWASGYIMAANMAGIVNGYGNGNFGPNKELTYEQAMKMLVCTLGYAPKAEASGGYPTGYMLVANQVGITKGTKHFTGPIERLTMAKLLYNSLTVPLMEQTSFGSVDGPEYKIIESSSVQYVKLGVIMTEAKLISFKDKAAEFEYISFDDVAALNGWTTEEDGEFTLPAEISVENADLTGLVGKTLNVYLNISDAEKPEFIRASIVE